MLFFSVDFLFKETITQIEEAKEIMSSQRHDSISCTHACNISRLVCIMYIKTTATAITTTEKPHRQSVEVNTTIKNVHEALVRIARIPNRLVSIVKCLYMGKFLLVDVKDAFFSVFVVVVVFVVAVVFSLFWPDVYCNRE